MNTLIQKVFAFAFDHLVAQKFVTGRRAYLGGASFIVGGLVIVIDMVISGAYDQVQAEKAAAAFALGYTIIGAAGKADKAIEAVAAKEKGNAE